MHTWAHFRDNIFPLSPPPSYNGRLHVLLSWTLLVSDLSLSQNSLVGTIPLALFVMTGLQ